MEPTRLDVYKNLLNRQLDELIQEAHKAINGMTDNKAAVADVTDRASHETDRNFLLRIKDRERKLILKIKEALTRIEKGEFGNCEECGEPISEKRLLARPVTTYCINCKTSQEEDEHKVQ